MDSYKIKIGDKFIGENSPSFIIAEIGSNHNNDWDMALRHIDAAVESGADAVKFQSFKASKHVSKKLKLPRQKKDEKTIYELLKTLEINRHWHKPLFDYCNKKNIVFFSSPCDYEAVDELDEIGVLLHKIASFDITDLELVKYIAGKSRPIIVSTGMAHWKDIERVVNASESVNNDQIILLQCTSLYPAPVSLSNLKSMSEMRKRFGKIIGYSDHTIGDNIPCAAVAMGAKVIEKHFTLDRGLDGPDHHFAMEPNELKEMVKKIREIELAIGDGHKLGPRKDEIENSKNGRRTIHAAVDIQKGEEIRKEMLTIKRPGLGIEPYKIDHIINKRAKRFIEKDEWITWEMIQKKS